MCAILSRFFFQTKTKANTTTKINTTNISLPIKNQDGNEDGNDDGDHNDEDETRLGDLIVFSICLAVSLACRREIARD